jgi:hypothetical protein
MKMWKYSKLSSQEPGWEDETKQRPSSRVLPWSGRVRWLAVAILATIVSSVAFYAYSTHQQHESHDIPPKTPETKAQTQSVDCGTTRAEALTKGCRLDVMADTWLPAPCFNETTAAAAFSHSDVLANFSGAGLFDWYLDENHTQPVTIDGLAGVDALRAYTWQVYHVAHCIYSWQTLVGALNRVIRGETGVYIHSKLLEEGHAHHCAMVLAANGGEEGFLRGTAVEVRFGLGECVDLAGMKGFAGLPSYHAGHTNDGP